MKKGQEGMWFKVGSANNNNGWRDIYLVLFLNAPFNSQFHGTRYGVAKVMSK